MGDAAIGLGYLKKGRTEMKTRKQSVDSVKGGAPVTEGPVVRWFSAMGRWLTGKPVASEVRRKRRLSLWFDVSE